MLTYFLWSNTLDPAQRFPFELFPWGGPHDQKTQLQLDIYIYGGIETLFTFENPQSDNGSHGDKFVNE